MPTALPSSSSWTATDRTKEQVRQATEQLRAYLSGLFGEDGSNVTALKTLGATLVDTVALSSATTITSSHRGKLIIGSGTWTLSLTSASTLGAGFAFAVVNIGSGSITIDPSGAETIDGNTALTLLPGNSCIVVCTGTAWYTLGAILNSGVAQGTYGSSTTVPQITVDARGRVTAATNVSLSYVSLDQNFNNVGSFCFARSILQGQSNPGTTRSGSLLYPASAQGSAYSTALPGTWRCLGYINDAYESTLWQRIS
jgi:type II secretory pathway pseudopilin PulG